ncbi:hypothetical protein B9Z55_016203 [Caenorhabditis nigoni]|uniref:Uncharacterized protein n=1 Tax=Caenorhabditis nigoni TaxID=1611254 RepID=A0A2G5UDL4_9PELO|nr:hypothetical protein B9Z55_016203 [Caenorhabditis nigoni]
MSTESTTWPFSQLPYLDQLDKDINLFGMRNRNGGRHNGVLHFRNSPKEEHRCYVGGRRSCSRSQGGGNQEKKKVSGTAKRLADEIAVGAVETEVHEDVPKPKNEN